MQYFKNSYLIIFLRSCKIYEDKITQMYKLTEQKFHDCCKRGTEIAVCEAVNSGLPTKKNLELCRRCQKRRCQQ